MSIAYYFFILSVTPSLAQSLICYIVSIAVNVLYTISSTLLTLLLRLSPAVSISINSFFTFKIAIYSILVAKSSLGTTPLPKSLLIKEDFPTLGFPVKAIRTISSFSSSPWTESKCSTTLSNISPNPSPWDADIVIGLRYLNYKIHKHYLHPLGNHFINY